VHGVDTTAYGQVSRFHVAVAMPKAPAGVAVCKIRTAFRSTIYYCIVLKTEFFSQKRRRQNSELLSPPRNAEWKTELVVQCACHVNAKASNARLVCIDATRSAMMHRSTWIPSSRRAGVWCGNRRLRRGTIPPRRAGWVRSFAHAFTFAYRDRCRSYCTWYGRCQFPSFCPSICAFVCF
jgi:hypothetical protein